MKIPRGILTVALLASLALASLALPALAQAPPVMPTNQAFRSVAITPSDSADLPGGVALGVYNGSAAACNITMTLQNDTASVLWSNVQAGAVLPIRVKRVFSTGTGCTGLVAMYPQ